ncbi:hypothetical protein AB833_31395 [Chromatiales bacterium (ex Bugula neritina AB1)]|nr:hypothetical protein AB833_31395 [Chromatiales bacterium (ex Bugula neritina AB1)]
MHRLKISKTNQKLETRLRIALHAILLAFLVLATISAAIVAYFGSSELQDETLLSVALLVNTNQIGLQTNRSLYRHHDYDDGVHVWKISGDRGGAFWINKSISKGYHTINARDEFWRVYITADPESENRFAIVQKLNVKTNIALRSAMNTAVPLLGLFLLMPILISLIMRHSFSPLNKLGRKVGNSESLKLDMANREDIPVEVLPFVSSIESLLEKNAEYNHRQQRFIADAAHELRTPITALSLEVENLRKAKSPAVKEEREKLLLASISRLQRLVNQLLDLARAQSAEITNQAPVSLNDLLKTQIADIYALAESKDIEFIVENNDDVHVLDINNQLQHLVRNSLSNAIKFSPESSQIMISLLQLNNNALYSVTDSGPGVANEDLDRLHEPFYRPVEQSTDSGAGLGLAISHEIAQQLGGHLVFENLTTGGFRFSYTQSLCQNDSDRNHCSQ